MTHAKFFKIQYISKIPDLKSRILISCRTVLTIEYLTYVEHRNVGY